MSQDSLGRFIELVLSTAQAGLTFSKDPYDIARFQSLQQAAAQFLADHSDADARAIRDWMALDKGYPTPKLDVRACIVNADMQVLMVRERSDDRWTLPGGWADIGESPAEAIAREVLEETGLVCKPTQLLALFDKHKHPHPPQLPHAYKAFFLCEVQGGDLLEQTMETAGARYFSAHDLPELSTHRVVRSQMETLFDLIQRGQGTSLFD